MFETYRGGRSGVVNVGIVITDGQSQNFSLTVSEAAKARDEGIEMYAVGVGPKIKFIELQGIASDPDSQYVYTVEDFDSLIQKKDFFAQQHCKGKNISPFTRVYLCMDHTLTEICIFWLALFKYIQFRHMN